MKSIKPGRGPSMMGGVAAIAIAIFGILWTIGASSITSSMGSDPFFADTMGPMDTIFPLFGVVFVCVAVVMAIYHFKNATGKQRHSSFDIVDGHEEPDPLNERFGQQSTHAGSRPTRTAGSFCPYCGAEVDGDYRFCNKCGKELPRN